MESLLNSFVHLSQRAERNEQLGELQAATDNYERAAQLRLDDCRIIGRLGFLNDELGNLETSIKLYRRLVELQPNNKAARSNLCLAINYSNQYTAQEVFEVSLITGRQLSTPAGVVSKSESSDRRAAEGSESTLYNPPQPSLTARNNCGRSRIGYISADFREHPRTRFLLPVIANHDVNTVEVICYSDVRHSDKSTLRFQKHATRWRSITGMADDEAAQIIRADKLVALIDMSGHMGDNRLGLFAKRAAPIQIHYPGYPGTTGLETMDYCLTDALRDPPGAEEFYTEQLIRLDGGSQCYDPTCVEAAGTWDTSSIGPPPSERIGKVTFGCFNRLVKVSDRCLDLWSSAMSAVFNSRLMLLAAGNEVDCPRIREGLVRRGISTSRIYFLTRRDRPAYMALHNLIDISLDTFPYHGHTTTLDALWMGVPTVSLRGSTRPAREGLAMLSAVGLEDLATFTDAAFVSAAGSLAGDLERRRCLRNTLRDTMKRSTLMDGRRVAKAIEDVVRRICAK